IYYFVHYTGLLGWWLCLSSFQLSHLFIVNVLIVIVAGKQWHLRLESGGSRCDGRVEIYHNGTWGRLLDDSWNISDADVICRQLNCGSAVSVYNSSQYGEGSGPVWINNVQCAGTETHIWNCPYSTVASSSRTSRDVGVLCSGECTLLRLVDDGSSCSGTVEVYRHGDWRRVRDQFWDLNDANVVCRQMGCGPAIRSYNSTVYREGERSPWLKDVHCQGNETNLLKCKPSRRNQSTEDMCDVGVQCSKDTHIRLMDRGSSCAGRVEIYYNETWGTVCDDSWGSREADVVCKQLGCGSAVDAISAAPCGSASGQVWLDEVRCSGKESALSECASSEWGQHDSYQSGSVISALTDESDVSGVHPHRVIKVKTDNFVQEEILSRLSLLVQVTIEFILIYWPILLQSIHGDLILGDCIAEYDNIFPHHRKKIPAKSILAMVRLRGINSIAFCYQI
uniref:SRCR domain-containing protein n=1 Tax=Callorhinchus milii TaxID=7868 RepID=A0A4W3I8H5_CALMI